MSEGFVSLVSAMPLAPIDEPPKKDITVGKGPYKNGTYGFKINGAQKMLVGSSVRYE